jgi:hypothetical protein
MNSSLQSADRTTHLKVVVVALAAAIAVVAIGINARVADTGGATARIQTNGPVLKAGKPAIYSSSDLSRIR